MKTTIFHLSDPSYEESNPRFDIYNEIFDVPSLPAYAILNSRLGYRASVFDEAGAGNNYEIAADKVVVKNVKIGFPGEKIAATLTIYYSGIRDYRLLFPQVNDKLLKERLGQLAEEADKTFETGAWMSFTILMASIIEGLLFDIYKKGKLCELINKGIDDSILSREEGDLVHKARKIRNRIHPARFQEPFADRKIGNDLYVLYDRLIKKRWVSVQKRAESDSPKADV